MALTKANDLFHRGQLGRLGLGVMRESGWKEQRNVGDVVVRGEGGELKFWLIHLLKLTKLCELAADSCTQFDGALRKFIRTLLCNKST